MQEPSRLSYGRAGAMLARGWRVACGVLFRAHHLACRLNTSRLYECVQFSAGAKHPLSVIGGNFVYAMTVPDVRFVRYSEVRGVRISEVEMYGVHAVAGRGNAVCPL